MGNIQAGFLVPLIIIIFMIMTFFIFRFFTRSVVRKRQKNIDTAIALYNDEMQAGHPEKAAQVIQQLLSRLKAGALSYAETAPLFLHLAEALISSKKYDEALLCALIIQKQIPANTVADFRDRSTLLENALIIEQSCSNELSPEQLEVNSRKVQNAWASSPNSMHELLA